MKVYYRLKTNINDILFMFKKSQFNDSIDYYGLVHGYVYLLLKGEEVVYIGASTSKDRIKAHKNRSKKDFDQVYYMVCNHKDECWRIEKELISRFKTKYNKCVTAKHNHSRINKFILEQ